MATELSTTFFQRTLDAMAHNEQKAAIIANAFRSLLEEAQKMKVSTPTGEYRHETHRNLDTVELQQIAFHTPDVSNDGRSKNYHMLTTVSIFSSGLVAIELQPLGGYKPPYQNFSCDFSTMSSEETLAQIIGVLQGYDCAPRLKEALGLLAARPYVQTAPQPEQP